MYEITRGHSAIRFQRKTVIAPHDTVALYVDSFANFGWELTGSESCSQDGYYVRLRFRRDRRPKNRMELDQLEKELESYLGELQRLEKKNRIRILAPAWGLGATGVALIIGAVLCFSMVGMIPGFLLLLPAIASWGLGYAQGARFLREKGDNQAVPEINKRYTNIRKTCAKAQSLLAL